MKQHDAVFSRFALQHIDVRVVDGFTGLSADDRRAWNTLFEKLPDATPFQSLCWNEIWWSIFGQSSHLTVKRAIILVLSLNDEIIAFFPMFRATLSALGVPLLRHIKPMGNDPNLTELKTGIVSEGHEKEAYATLIDYFRRVDRQWEFATLPAIPAETASAGMAQAFEHPTLPVIEGFIIPLTANWDAFRGGLKRNVKEAIRKCQNSLKRDGVEPVFACLSDAAAIRDMLPEFYRLHGMRAKEQNGVHHPDYFRLQEARQLIDLLASDPVKSGIRLFILKDGARVIAARLAFETPGGTYLYYSGYDLEYGKYSIMTRLVVEVLKRSIDRGQHYVHLSFGRDGSKTRWSPREVAYKLYLITHDSPGGRLLAALYTAFSKAGRKRAAQQPPLPQ